MGELYKNIDGNTLNVEINSVTDNCILISVHNLSYRTSLQKNMGLISLVLLGFVHLIIFTQFYNVILVLVAIFIILSYKIYNLVKLETVYFFKNFAIQTSTEFALGRKQNLFISNSNFKDLIINEVIVDLRVVFMLNILTKGSLFATKPIIPILKHTQPNLECLEMIYRALYTKIITI